MARNLVRDAAVDFGNNFTGHEKYNLLGRKTQQQPSERLTRHTTTLPKNLSHTYDSYQQQHNNNQ